MNAELENLISQRRDRRIALLLGSMAEGHLRPDSDVDIAVSIGRPLTADERMELMAAVAGVTGRPVDLIDLETSHGLILKHALTKGMSLIPSRPETRERLLKRMVYEQEDLAPQIARAKADRVEAFAHGY